MRRERIGERRRERQADGEERRQGERRRCWRVAALCEERTLTKTRRNY